MQDTFRAINISYADSSSTINISYADSSSTILKNVSFSFHSKEIVCLLGNNGSGKSTLLKLCAGIFKPSSGSVQFNGTNILSYDDTQRAKIIGLLPQNIHRPHNVNLLEFMQLNPQNLTQDSKNKSVFKPLVEDELKKRRFEESLELFELLEFKEKNINTMSGGEWKRAQIARLWQTKSQILLLDEPDSDLDLRHKKRLIRYCKNYVQENKAIMLIVTHDTVFAREVADKICALDNGHLVWSSRGDEFWNTKVINKIFSTKVL